MTQKQLREANYINDQIETLERFLNYNRKCWGILRFFHTPKEHSSGISINTSYGIYQDEVTCSKRLAESIVNVVENEIAILRDELDVVSDHK